MITVTIDNSYSTIKGLSTAQEKQLKELLSYTVGDHFSRFGPKKKSLLSRRGEFPSGLLSRIFLWVGAQKSTFEYVDLRVCPPMQMPAKFVGPHPRMSQQAALTQALQMESGTISMPTGSGKSLVIALICATYNLKTLVIVPNLGIKEQLKSLLKDLKNVTVENIDSKSLLKPKGYDLLIIDEAHHSAANTYQKLNRTAWKDIYHRFFLTATPFRNRQDETILFEAIAGDLIFQTTYQEALAEGAVVPVESYVYQVPKSKVEGVTWAQVYSELVVNNEARNVMIAVLLLRLHYIEKSTLCLVKEVSHGKKLSEATGIPFISGQTGEDRSIIEEFSAGRVKILIATEGIMGEGIDSKACEYVILAGLGKAKSAILQKVGRAVRTFPGKESAKVILFKDDSHKWTKAHYAVQKKIINEQYGAQTLKLEI